MSSGRRGGADQYIVLSGGAGNPLVLAGTVDPSAGGGVPAPEGSTYMRYVAAAGEIWIKTGAANTAWTLTTVGIGRWNTYVFRPGGVDDPLQNVWTTWPSLMIAMASRDGPGLLEFDDSIVTPCVIPAGGPWNMTNVTWRGRAGRFVYAANVDVTSGAQFTGLRRFERNLFILSRAILPDPPPVNDLVDDDRIELDWNVDISSFVNVDLVPFFRSQGWIELDMDWGCSFGRRVQSRTVLDMAAVASEVNINLGDGCRIFYNTLSGVATTVKHHYARSPSAQFDIPQVNFLGTTDHPYRIDQAFRLNPEGATPSVAPVTANCGNFIRLNCTVGAITQVLPRITGAVLEDSFGRWVAIKETSGLNGVVVDGFGAETINGALTYDIPPGGAALFTSDGTTNWTAIGIDLNHILNRLNTFTQAQGTAQVNLPDNVAGITPNLALSNSHQCLLGAVAGNTRQIGVPTGMVAGFTYLLEFVQPAGPTAVQALTYNAAWWKFPGGTIPVLTATNSAKDIITAYYDGTAMQCVFQPDFRNP